MADYVDALYAHHFGDDAAPNVRAAAVHDLMRAQEVALLQPLLDHLAAKNSARLLGPTDAAVRAPTVAVALARPGRDVAADLVERGMLCDGGNFYAVRALQAQGVDPEHGVLRMSFVHYTTEAEVDRLISALDQVL
jgi:selenocysteine lyase/cysteine desulfurase